MIDISAPKEFHSTPNADRPWPSVFSGFSPNPSAWTELDLSAWVGKRNAFVILEFQKLAEGNVGYSIRPGSSAGDALPFNFPLDAGGCNSIHADYEHYSYLCIVTDSDGCIDWYCNGVDIGTGIRLAMFIA